MVRGATRPGPFFGNGRSGYESLPFSGQAVADRAARSVAVSGRGRYCRMITNITSSWLWKMRLTFCPMRSLL